jgi:tetratricopeptide (TPR) repeat protein
MRALTWIVPLVLAGACVHALHEPPPLGSLGSPTLPSRVDLTSSRAVDVDALLPDAAARFGERPDPSAVAAALDLYLRAARADEHRVEGLLGAATALAWLVEHEHDAARRQALAIEAVQACQWCLRRAPGNVECTYHLALAVGLQARERRSTALDGLKEMVSLLEDVIVRAPKLDGAGGHRVLGLVLLRAPGWPAGPGDPDAGLEHARQADALVPDNPENLLVLGEALAATGHEDEARAAYSRAEVLARTRAAKRDPDASEWAEAAARALKDLRR